MGKLNRGNKRRCAYLWLCLLSLREQLNDNSTESALPEQLENATEPEEGFLSPPEMIRTEDLPPIEMPGIFPDGKEPEDVNGTDPAIIGPIVPGDGDLGNGTEPVDIDPEIPDDHIPEHEDGTLPPEVGEDGTLPPEVGEDDQIIITRAPGGGP